MLTNGGKKTRKKAQVKGKMSGLAGTQPWQNAGAE